MTRSAIGLTDVFVEVDMLEVAGPDVGGRDEPADPEVDHEAAFDALGNVRHNDAAVAERLDDLVPCLLEIGPFLREKQFAVIFVASDHDHPDIVSDVELLFRAATRDLIRPDQPFTLSGDIDKNAFFVDMDDDAVDQIAFDRFFEGRFKVVPAHGRLPTGRPRRSWRRRLRQAFHGCRELSVVALFNVSNGWRRSDRTSRKCRLGRHRFRNRFRRNGCRFGR